MERLLRPLISGYARFCPVDVELRAGRYNSLVKPPCRVTSDAQRVESDVSISLVQSRDVRYSRKYRRRHLRSSRRYYRRFHRILLFNTNINYDLTLGYCLLLETAELSWLIHGAMSFLSLRSPRSLTDSHSQQLVAIYIYYLRCRDTRLYKEDSGACYFDVTRGNRREKKRGECEPRS